MAGFSLAFSSSTAATASITPAGGSATTYALTRFPVDGVEITAAPSWVPQTGWWYSPAYSGTGIFLESQGQATLNGEVYSRLFMVVMAYGSAGQATWYAAGGDLPVFSGTLNEFAGGPTLTGSSGSLRVLGERGAVTAVFTSTTAGSLALPNGATLSIQRFTAF